MSDEAVAFAKQSFGEKDPAIIAAALQRIYDRIPSVACRRQCGEFCGPVSFLPAEVVNVRHRGYQLPTVTDFRPDHSQCTAFVRATGDKRVTSVSGVCAIYEVRPLICRIYGVVKRLQCPQGCRPKRYLSREDVHTMIRAISELLPGERYHTHPLGMELIGLVKQLSKDGTIPEGGFR